MVKSLVTVGGCLLAFAGTILVLFVGRFDVHSTVTRLGSFTGLPGGLLCSMTARDWLVMP
jgi:hypothetical protein